MKKILFIALITMANLISNAQVNLVPNPSFEQYDTCPFSTGQLKYAYPWTSPIHTTPDYFNICDTTNDFSVPSNYVGFENAKTGVGYAAIAIDVYNLSNPLNDDYREYIQVRLLSQLQTGIKYCIKIYLSAADSMNYVSNDIGVYFSPIEIQFPTWYNFPLPFLPQFENTKDLSSRNGWTEVSGEFTASGDERYIIIGNFKDHISTTSYYTGWSPLVNLHFSAACYIDDVSVYRCDLDSNIIMPNTFTPNGDGFNDKFIPLEKIDSFSGLLKIFDRWGLQIFSTDNIYEGWDGGNSSDGVYYWELIYTNNLRSNHSNKGYVVLIR